MAGSRLEKLGTVFTRTRDLLRSRVLAEAQKPLWFDVYAAFPPLREPVYREPGQRYGKVKDVIPPILYQEDEIRATFYEAYGNGPKAFELSQLNFKSTCQRAYTCKSLTVRRARRTSWSFYTHLPGKRWWQRRQLSEELSTQGKLESEASVCVISTPGMRTPSLQYVNELMPPVLQLAEVTIPCLGSPVLHHCPDRRTSGNVMEDTSA
uniref:Small ribosomal subunit protein mS23 n=1 Tax=Chrysemys picta bellii TaxID=8478 RepID=A0A8C3FST9_CHRPI